jgi:hypothetical protein
VKDWGARRAGLDGTAVHAVAAGPVQRTLKPLIPKHGVRHAPALRRWQRTTTVEVELIHLLHVGVEQAKVLLDVVWTVALVVLVEEGEDVHVRVGVGVERSVVPMLPYSTRLMRLLLYAWALATEAVSKSLLPP